MSRTGAARFMSRSIYAPMNTAVTMFLEDASMVVIAA
jgi:hypothetical protein